MTPPLNFALGPGETAHQLADGATVCVCVTAREPADHPGWIVLQVDADVVDATSGAVAESVEPHEVTVPPGVLEEGTLDALIANARTKALERVAHRRAAARAIAQLPRTPEPGKSARRRPPA